jgi:hypothetical protein
MSSNEADVNLIKRCGNITFNQHVLVDVFAALSHTARPINSCNDTSIRRFYRLLCRLKILVVCNTSTSSSHIAPTSCREDEVGGLRFLSAVCLSAFASLVRRPERTTGR